MQVHVEGVVIAWSAPLVVALVGLAVSVVKSGLGGFLSAVLARRTRHRAALSEPSEEELAERLAAQVNISSARRSQLSIEMDAATASQRDVAKQYVEHWRRAITSELGGSESQHFEHLNVDDADSIAEVVEAAERATEAVAQESPTDDDTT